MRGGLNRSKSSPSPQAIKAWPKAPKGFTKDEAAAWQAIGQGLVELGSAARSDLILARLAARTLARCEAALDEPDLKVSQVSSLTRLVADLLNRLGLSPQARTTVAPLPEEDDGHEDPLR